MVNTKLTISSHKNNIDFFISEFTPKCTIVLWENKDSNNVNGI